MEHHAWVGMGYPALVLCLALFAVYLLISTEEVLVNRVVFLSIQPPFLLSLPPGLSLQPPLLCRPALCSNVPRHHCEENS